MYKRDTISDALHRLGIYENTQKYSAVAVAVHIALNEPGSLQLVTKWLYPEAAKQCGVNWQALEKSLHATVSVIWKNNPERLQALSAVPLKRKPTASQFIALLASALRAEVCA